MPKAAKCTNPLFLQWVKGFHAEKDYRIRGGPPRATGYEGAIAALEACTVRYEHPAEMKGKYLLGERRPLSKGDDDKLDKWLGASAARTAVPREALTLGPAEGAVSAVALRAFLPA
ncbi:hypothetical protein FIBSPDRAFT_944776 [Athelia psychrophila]|uniref:Uncharacterized protein n=1 Tax=Athelia psychrophila TaxID=1759441 RepID=A0A166UHT4_9AGAM|nr:hypothetical protein FIBSPDRAFT_944776 [Fibularhizoctonia sp. CBS 109695]